MNLAASLCRIGLGLRYDRFPSEQGVGVGLHDVIVVEVLRYTPRWYDDCHRPWLPSCYFSACINWTEAIVHITLTHSGTSNHCIYLEGLYLLPDHDGWVC